MDQLDQRDQNKRFLLILLAALIPFAALTTLLLTSIFGPSDYGVHCTRERGLEGKCEVLQSRFLGLAGNRAFPIPESEIAGARADCANRGVGGRAGASCSVDLLLKSGPYRGYPVLSYPLIGQAESSARKLNDYFADPTRPSIALEDEPGKTVLVIAGLPLLTIVVLLALRRWRGRVPQANAARRLDTA